MSCQQAAILHDSPAEAALMSSSPTHHLPVRAAFIALSPSHLLPDWQPLSGPRAEGLHMLHE